MPLCDTLPETGIQFRMDARLLIAPLPLDIYQACVIDTEQARGWCKTYFSKEECVTELKVLDLLLPNVADEVMVDDFDKRDRILIFKTSTEPETLEEAGFDERMPVVRN